MTSPPFPVIIAEKIRYCNLSPLENPLGKICGFSVNKRLRRMDPKAFDWCQTAIGALLCRNRETPEAEKY